jgi:phage shock protein PspC (stress-responsive transcriptional regulator)
MNTTSVNPEAPTTEPQPPFASGPDRLPLRRPLEDRMLAGVAAGLARYFGVDVTIVRIAFVVLTVVGGAGLPLYLAGLLLIPEEGSDQSIAGSLIESLQARSR